jgi:hypothetical protein
MEETYGEIDPGLDAKKGPFAVVDYSVSTEIARTDNTADYLRSVYQLGNPDLQEDEDIVQLGLNYGMDPNIGNSSRVIVYLYRSAKPEVGELLTVDAGTQVSDEDGRFVFATLDEVTMNGDYADVYYNSEEARYEVAVLAESIAIGIDYNLPPLSVNRFIIPIAGFDGVINKDYALGGSDPVDKIQFRNMIWDAVRGIGADLAGYIIRIIENLNPAGFDDISIIPSTDYESFKRLGRVHSKVGYDIYLISDAIQETIKTGTTLGGETQIPLDLKPALAVRYVVVNGAEIPFSLSADTDPAVQGSPRANDVVTFTTPLGPALPYEIRYIYYDLIYEGNDALEGRNAPFETDVLVRRANSVEIIIVGQIKTFSTADKNDVIDDLRAFTVQYLRDPDNPSSRKSTYYELLDPSDYQSTVEQAIDGLLDFKLDRFARLDRAFTDVDTIYFDGLTEYPLLSPLFDIT